MNNMVYAPVKITTLCRYEHFKRCIESLARCTGAAETELFIGVDYPTKEEHWPGYRQICEYVDTISGFKQVNVFKRTENLGQGKNTRDLINRIGERFDRYISTEDDNEFSPNFLVYMNKYLERYKDDNRVFAVCGYSYLEWEGLTDRVGEAFPMIGYCAWGTGFWIAKNDSYIRTSLPAKDIIFNPRIVKFLFANRMHHIVHYLMFRYKTNAADLRRCCFNTLNGKYSIYPKISKVRNWGFDSSGSHCAVIDTYARQRIDDRDSFDCEDFELQEDAAIRKLHDVHYAKGRMARLLTRLEYFQWRITGKTFKDYAVLKKMILLRLKRLNSNE